MDKKTFRMILVISLLINAFSTVSNAAEVVKTGHASSGILAFISSMCFVLSIYLIVRNWNNPNLTE